MTSAEMTTDHVILKNSNFIDMSRRPSWMYKVSERLWTGGWCGQNVCGVRIIFGVLWRRPVAREPDVRHGNLVGIEGVGVGTLQLLLWDEMEADSEMDGEETRTSLVGDGLVDETVHDFSHPLDGLDG